MNSFLGKAVGNPNTTFRHENSLIIPRKGGIHNKEKLYAVIFFIKLVNNIISIDTFVYQVKQTNNNKYTVKKLILTKNINVAQEIAVDDLINDMLHGKFHRIQLPKLAVILSLISGVAGNAKASPVFPEESVIPVSTEYIKGEVPPFVSR